MEGMSFMGKQVCNTTKKGEKEEKKRMLVNKSGHVNVTKLSLSRKNLLCVKLCVFHFIA